MVMDIEDYEREKTEKKLLMKFAERVVLMCAILYAFLAAVFYAINVPMSKILLQNVGPTTMAALLYLGAGIGIGILSLIHKKDRVSSDRLSKKDLPFVIGMIVLDIAAPICLMLGISYGSDHAVQHPIVL